MEYNYVGQDARCVDQKYIENDINNQKIKGNKIMVVSIGPKEATNDYN